MDKNETNLQSDDFFLHLLITSFLILYDLLHQVNQKMMLTLTASIMYWCLKRPITEDRTASSDGENGSSSETTSTSALDDTASESSLDDSGGR